MLHLLNCVLFQYFILFLYQFYFKNFYSTICHFSNFYDITFNIHIHSIWFNPVAFHFIYTWCIWSWFDFSFLTYFYRKLISEHVTGAHMKKRHSTILHDNFTLISFHVCTNNHSSSLKWPVYIQYIPRPTFLWGGQHIICQSSGTFTTIGCCFLLVPAHFLVFVTTVIEAKTWTVVSEIRQYILVFEC